MKTLDINYTGRKAQTGRICFDEKGRMHIFVAYCPRCNGKVVMTREEAENFSLKYVGHKQKTVDRLILSLAKKRQL